MSRMQTRKNRALAVARETERLVGVARAASRIIPLGRKLDADTWASLPTGTTATVTLPDGQSSAVIVHARPAIWTMSVPYADAFGPDELVGLTASRVWIPEPTAAAA